MAESKFRFTLSNEAIGTFEITAPMGWDDMQHTLSRDALYHGVWTKYTLDFSFVKDGYGFLQSVYNTFGIQGEALFVVYELLPNAHRWEAAYAGRINLAKYVATETSCTTNAEETGFTRQLLNLEEVEINLHSLKSIEGLPLAPFTIGNTGVGALAVDVEPLMLHSKAIVKRYEASVTASNPEFSYRPVGRPEDYFGTLYVGFDEVKANELDAFSYQTGLQFSDGRDELIEFTEKGTITVEYKLNLTVECLLGDDGDFDAATVNFFLGLGPVDDANPQYAGRWNPDRIYHWNNREAYGGGDNINGDFRHNLVVAGTKTFNVEIGDKLYFYGDCKIYDISEPLFGSPDFEWRINANVGTSLRISGATTTEATPANGVLIHEAFARVVSSITGREDAFYSELLGRMDSHPVAYKEDGEMSLIWLTNGSQLRGFPREDVTTTDAAGKVTVVEAGRPIFANLKKLHQSLNALRPVGMGPERTPEGHERLRLEGVEWFYRPEVVLALGQVAELKLSVAPEYYYNQSVVGFEKWGSNADNSLDEVNTKQTRILPITQLKNTYTALSEYVGSGYLIEETRREQYSRLPDKENPNDKTNFWICVLRKPGGGFEPERNQGLTARNILSPETSYNLRITPQRNFKRHGPLLRAGLRFRETLPVAFQEGNANYIAETEFDGEAAPTVENEPITGADLAPALWIPEYYEFEAPLPLDQRKLIEANPHGRITFMDGSQSTKSGYLKEIKVNLNTSMATFKLLRANI